MVEQATRTTSKLHPRWRIAAWGGAAALLALPAVAMRFTPQVQWDETDFIVMGVLLATICLVFETLARHARGLAHVAASALAAFGLLLLVWVNLAVGIIGSEDNGANLMYAGVVAVAFAGAAVARLRPRGLARAMAATAVAQLAVGVIALAGGLGTDGHAWPRDTIGATGVFVMLWLAAAAMFALAARQADD